VAKKGRDGDSVRVSLAAIAIGAGAVAAGAITALVVIAAVRKVETLTTVALALAIVAFVTQILLFIAQTWSSGHLNAETMGFLSELRTRSQGTEALLNKQIDKLTDDLMARGAAARKETRDPELTRERVRRDVAAALGSSELTAMSQEGAFRRHPLNPRNLPRPQLEPLAELVATFPTEDEARALLPILRALSPSAVGELMRFGRDLQDVYMQESGVPGFPADEPSSEQQKELLDKGLLEDITSLGQGNPLGDGKPWLVLTEKGRDVARLGVGRGPIPTYLRS
jgi:hypothetical protein